MAYAHGKNLVFKLDNASGTLIDLSDYVDDASPSTDLDTAEVTNGGSGGVREHIVGLEGGSFSVSGPWDPTLEAHMAGLLAAFRSQSIASVSFEHQPAGTGTGKRVNSGEAILSSYDVDDSVDDAVRWSAELLVTGGMTRGVQP